VKLGARFVLTARVEDRDEHHVTIETHAGVVRLLATADV
jgi:hypothetical protein